MLEQAINDLADAEFRLQKTLALAVYALAVDSDKFALVQNPELEIVAVRFQTRPKIAEFAGVESGKAYLLLVETAFLLSLLNRHPDTER